MMKLLLALVLIVATKVEAEGKELEKFTRKGKIVTQEASGDIDVKIQRRKWGGEKERFLCCAFSSKHCKGPCAGAQCTAQCTVRCGFLSLWVCPPLTCQSANPSQCTSTTGCIGGTAVGAKCFTFSAGPSTWLAALAECVTAGGSLAKIETQAEQTAAAALTGGANTYIGLSDISTEATFSWADGSPLGTFTNWIPGQPTSTAASSSNQHCVQMRGSDGAWNDIRCDQARAFLCQK